MFAHIMELERATCVLTLTATVAAAAATVYLFEPRLPFWFAEAVWPGRRRREAMHQPVMDADDEDPPTWVSDMGRIRELLLGTKLRDFLKDRHKGRPEGVPSPRDVLVLTPSCTVNDALTKLSERAVLGAPYLRDDGKDFLGFVDLHDIVHALVSHMFPPGPLGTMASHDAPDWFLTDDSPACADRILTLVRDKGGDFCDRTLGSIRRRVGDGAFIRVDETDHSLLDVIQTHFVNAQYTKPPVRHRVAVYKYAVDASRLTDAETTIEVTDVFSVSDITRFLNRWNELEKCLTPCSIVDIGVGSTRVDAVPKDAALLRCFAVMERVGVSGLGVTDDGKLIGSVSESDLRRITADRLDVLAMPVGEFIGKLHALSGEDNPLREDQMALARAHPLFRGALRTGELTGGRLNVTVSQNATLLEVIRALARNRVHRVYAVNETTGVADRVVTHSDLVRFFALFAPSD